MKPTVHLFYAADENYFPYLAVSLLSIKDNAARDRDYVVRVLHAGIDERAAAQIASLEDKHFSVQFVDVSDKLTTLAEKLQLRDYYTCTTYYRLFIAEMFPSLDKALYLDSDTVVLEDIGILYDHDLGDCLVGAAVDETVATTPVFRDYVREVLGVPSERYFNAGILLMNLRAFRNEDFTRRFHVLLGQYKFSVAQDQDYLNVLCKDRVLYLSPAWNKMPIPRTPPIRPLLLHYNLTRKPWHYEDTLYREYFWKYAEKSSFYRQILAELQAYSDERKQADAACEENLIALAVRETNRPDNYFKTYGSV